MEENATKERRKYSKLNSERKQLIVAYLKGQLDAKEKLDRLSFNQCSKLFNISTSLAIRIWKTTNVQFNQSANLDFTQLNFKSKREKRKDLKLIYKEKLKLADSKECRTFRQLSQVIGVSKSTCHNLFKLELLVKKDNLLVPNWDAFNSDQVDESTLVQLESNTNQQSVVSNGITIEELSISQTSQNQTVSLSVSDTQVNCTQSTASDSPNIVEGTSVDLNQDIIVSNSTVSAIQALPDLKIDGTIEDEFSD